MVLDASGTPPTPDEYSLLTTILQADAELKGIKEAGGDAALFQYVF
jgi:hypothetical protein